MSLQVDLQNWMTKFFVLLLLLLETSQILRFHWIVKQVSLFFQCLMFRFLMPGKELEKKNVVHRVYLVCNEIQDNVSVGQHQWDLGDGKRLF